MSSSASRYDGSPLIVADAPEPPDSRERYVPSDIPGGRAPHLWLDGGRGPGSSLFDHLGLGLTLLRFGGPQDVTALQGVARDRGIPLKIVDVTVPEGRALYSRNLYLVRPDFYIAWRGDQLPDDIGEILDTLVGRTTQRRMDALPVGEPAQE